MRIIDANDYLSSGGNMGRVKRTRMIIKDVKVQDSRCIISIEIRRGAHYWRRAYAFSAEQLREGDMIGFQEALQKRVAEDALKLEEDKNFEDRVLMRIEDLKDKIIVLN